MGKKADKWKAKYDELMRITEGYIRHLHEAHSRLDHFGGVKSQCGETQWDCLDDSDRHCCYLEEEEGAAKDLEEHIEELTGQLERRDRRMATAWDRHRAEDGDDREAELEESVSKLEDENGRLIYRVDDLETALRDLIGSAEELTATIHPLALASVSTGVHRIRGKEPSEYELWADLAATIQEAEKVLGSGEESESEEGEEESDSD